MAERRSLAAALDILEEEEAQTWADATRGGDEDLLQCSAADNAKQLRTMPEQELRRMARDLADI